MSKSEFKTGQPSLRLRAFRVMVGGSGLVKSFSKGQSYASITISPKKFDYFFGKVVEGNEHNVRRSASLAKELSTLGIKTDKQLMSIFTKTAKNGTVVKTQTNKFGTTITKSIQYKGSEIQTGFFYANGDLKSVPKVTTVITKLHK